MTDLNIGIRFESCRYSVVWPDFFLECSLNTAKRMLKWLCVYRDLNEESWQVVNSQMPDLVDMAHGHLEKALKDNDARKEAEMFRYWREEDRQDAIRYYQIKARHLRKMPQRAEQIQTYWKELNDGQHI